MQPCQRPLCYYIGCAEKYQVSFASCFRFPAYPDTWKGCASLWNKKIPGSFSSAQTPAQGSFRSIRRLPRRRTAHLSGTSRASPATGNPRSCAAPPSARRKRDSPLNPFCAPAIRIRSTGYTFRKRSSGMWTLRLRMCRSPPFRALRESISTSAHFTVPFRRRRRRKCGGSLLRTGASMRAPMTCCTRQCSSPPAVFRAFLRQKLKRACENTPKRSQKRPFIVRRRRNTKKGVFSRPIPAAARCCSRRPPRRLGGCTRWIMSLGLRTIFCRRCLNGRARPARRASSVPIRSIRKSLRR